MHVEPVSVFWLVRIAEFWKRLISLFSGICELMPGYPHNCNYALEGDMALRLTLVCSICSVQTLGKLV